MKLLEIVTVHGVLRGEDGDNDNCITCFSSPPGSIHIPTQNRAIICTERKAADKVLAVEAQRAESQTDLAPFNVLFPEKTPFLATLSMVVSKADVQEIVGEPAELGG